MDTKPYLIFCCHALQYGIEAALVQEIFSLPELTPVTEASTGIIGLINWREKTVPIMHLDLLQRHLLKGCSLSDYVIVLQGEELQFGLVVHHLNEVLYLNDKAVETDSLHALDYNIDVDFIYGVAKLDIGNIILLNVNTLIHQLDAVLPLIWDAQMQLSLMGDSPISDVEQHLEQDVSQHSEELQIPKTLSSFYDLYCPDVTPEERSIFRQRADNLRQPIESLNVTNQLMPLAVIGFGNEYFGLDLDLVRAFTDITDLTPIPCCPNHIVGNMNLRGEIVTLVDIRNTLNLPATPVSVGSKAVVVQVDDIVAGLPVDQVLEMVELNPTDIIPLPPVLSVVGDQYFRGTALFQEKMLRVLDLPKIFTQGGLAVNEQA